MSTTFIHKFIRLFFHLLDRRDENVVLQNGSDLACTQLGQLIVTEIQLGDVLVLLNNAAHHFNRVHVQVAADQSFQTRSFRREFDQKKKRKTKITHAVNMNKIILTKTLCSVLNTGRETGHRAKAQPRAIVAACAAAAALFLLLRCCDGRTTTTTTKLNKKKRFESRSNFLFGRFHTECKRQQRCR